jgi:WD40 repeat protein
MIWSLLIAGEYLFAGDSKGTLSVWDAEHGTLVKAFKQLQADV